MKFSIRDLLWLTVVVALSLALVYVKWPSGQGRYHLQCMKPVTAFTSLIPLQHEIGERALDLEVMSGRLNHRQT